MTRFILAFIALTSLLACNAPTNKEKPAQHWLSGCWKQLDAPEGTVGQEFWEIQHDQTMTGLGITLQGLDTVFKETLIIKDAKLIVTGAGNEAPVAFSIKPSSDTSFTASNPLHDFPQHIAYLRDGDTLRAKVYNDTSGIGFTFVTCKK